MEDPALRARVCVCVCVGWPGEGGEGGDEELEVRRQGVGKSGPKML